MARGRKQPEATAQEPGEAPAGEAAPRKSRRSAREPGSTTVGTKSASARKPIARAPRPERARGRRKERRGVVVSNAMDKTIVVRVETVKPDPRYKKVVRRSRKFHAHDEENAAAVGDVVRIVETRPLSKTKTWRLAEVVEKAR